MATLVEPQEISEEELGHMGKGDEEEKK